MKELQEIGVSVFDGRKEREDRYVIELPTRILSLMLAWCLDQNRPAFVVRGEVLSGDHGGAGEPLLRNATIVEQIPLSASITTDPVSGVRYRDDALEAWAAKRRKGKLSAVRADVAEKKHIERTYREAEEDGLDVLGGRMNGSVIHGMEGLAGPEGWPEFWDLRLGRTLGLSAGVYEVEDSDGVRYVLRDASGLEYRQHLKEQAVAEECYRILGLSMPPSAVYEPEDSSSEKLPRRLQGYVEGRSFLKLEYAKNVTLRTGVAAGFAVDALLGNSTVVGGIKDKVLLGVDGLVHRLAVRGALRYFWTGQRKPPELFGLEVRELETMRNTMTSAGEVFGNLTDAEVARQIENLILPKRDALFDVLASYDEELQELIGARVEYMRVWADKRRPNRAEKTGPRGSEHPDLPSLVEEVQDLATCPGKEYGIHGRIHWQRVAVCGYEITRRTPDVDPLLVFLFALFHDAMRETNADDPGHGARGGGLAAELIPGYPKLDLLRYACNEHTSGATTDDPTVGACWDADRLNLWRVGMRPDPGLMSTAAAKRAGLIAFARGLQYENHTWEDLIKAYGAWG